MSDRRGYTLVELLVVAVLAVMLLGISAAGYHTWIKSTAVDASTTVLLAELERARAYALARCCATRLTVFDDERGDLLLLERLDPENGEDWYPISRTNRLEWTHVASSQRDKPLKSFFFRQDGSCCTDEERLPEEAEFDEYGMTLQSRPSKAGTATERQEPREIFVNARTGLAKLGRDKSVQEVTQ